jgi:hypothetical protein
MGIVVIITSEKKRKKYFHMLMTEQEKSASRNTIMTIPTQTPSSVPKGKNKAARRQTISGRIGRNAFIVDQTAYVCLSCLMNQRE